MLSHAFGTVALMSMALTVILSARLRVIDVVFGGLDKNYVVHKWLGLTAFAAMLVHDTFEAEVKGVPDLFGLHELASDFGGWVYNSLLVLIAATFLHVIPYRWWRLSHRFMVAVFVLSMAHFVLIPKPLALQGFAGLYLLGFCGLGLIAALFALRPRSIPAPTPYVVTDVQHCEQFTQLTLSPKGRPLQHKAGQFAFLQLEGSSRREAHPFTIASSPQEDGSMRFMISRRIGWTNGELRKVTSDQTIWIDGPYGQFLRRPGSSRQVWLSAGIGVTPFLAWAAEGLRPESHVDIVHICRSRANAPDLSALETFAGNHPETVSLKIIETERTGRPTPHQLMRFMRDIPGKVDLYFCGPRTFYDDVAQICRDAKKGQFTVHHEAFELRGGLRLPTGLRQHLVTLGDGLGMTQWLPKSLRTTADTREKVPDQ
ncbi:ferredoxin reductase family protein [Falsiruegeria litorea]|nr:ferric reductase-like transmembrane domain-containing protein [Falsiruegeria litorea]